MKSNSACRPGGSARKLTVIILNWNGIDLLRRFLPSAIAHTSGPEVELVVADNGSSDDSVAWIRTNHPACRVIELGKNHGFAEGYNRAIAMTDTPYVTLLNSDVMVEAGWWQPLLAAMERDSSIGACQPKIRSFRQPEYFEYAGAAGGMLDRLGYPFCRGRLFECVEKDTGQYDSPEPADIAWASGAALTVRTDLYKQLGGLDAAFFAHMEEIDLCLRILASGHRVVAVTDSKVYHVGGASLAQGNPQKTYLNFRNNLLLLHKNLPAGRRGRVLLLRRLADTLAFAMYAAKGELANARAIVRAHTDFRKMRKKYTSHPRRDILRSLPGANHWAVLEHYLLRRKTIDN